MINTKPCVPQDVRVTLLKGGISGEREISLVSGESCAKALREEGFPVVCVTELMTHTPQWQHPAQRFTRLYTSSILNTPTALIIAQRKTKWEKGINEKNVECLGDLFTTDQAGIETFIHFSKSAVIDSLMYC